MLERSQLRVALFSATALLAPLTLSGQERFPVEDVFPILKATDGDTVVIDNGTEKGDSIRFIGLNTPEVFPFLTTKPNEYFAEEASAEMKALCGCKEKPASTGQRKAQDCSGSLAGLEYKYVNGARVQIVSVEDKKKPDRGKYGRLLAYVYLPKVCPNDDYDRRVWVEDPKKDGTCWLFLNGWMIKQGFGAAYMKYWEDDYYPFMREILLELEEEARESEKGFWEGKSQPEMEWIIKQGRSPIEIYAMGPGRWGVRYVTIKDPTSYIKTDLTYGELLEEISQMTEWFFWNGYKNPRKFLKTQKWFKENPFLFRSRSARKMHNYLKLQPSPIEIYILANQYYAVQSEGYVTDRLTRFELTDYLSMISVP